MTSTTTATRGFCFSLLVIVSLAFNAGAQPRTVAAAAPELGDAWRPAALDSPLPSAGLAVDVRFDTVRRAAATHGVLTLPLPGGRAVRFTAQWTQADATQVLVAGPLIDGTGDASLTVVGDALSGRIVVNGQLFVVRRMRDSAAHAVTEVNQSAMRPEAAPRVPPATAVRPAPDVVGGGDSNAFVDLMILYTPAARAEIGSTSAMVAELTGAVNNANLALANANVTHRYRLVYQGEVAYTENGFMSDTLDDLTSIGDGRLELAHTLRDQYRADVVTLLSNDFDACGVGWVMEPTEINASFAEWAFNVVAWDCANGNLSMAHEIGHNMGLQHDRPYAAVYGQPGSPAFPYAYGYAVNSLARDVMAYDFSCTLGCPRRAIYSTPLFNFPGTSTKAGTATEDNARALNGTSTAVANFRQNPCTFATSPASAGFASGGGTGTVSVTSNDATCPRTASNAAFVTVTSGAAGSGGGVVTYTVAPNPNLGSRTASITVANTTVTIFQAGRNNAGDIDGDGRSEIAVYRPSAGSWYYLRSSANFTGGSGYAWGTSTDQPIVGDFDGDGKNDLVAHRAATGHWFVLRSSSNFTTSITYQWGTNGDKPVAADYDGDGKTDLAVYRPSNGTWYVLTSSSNYTTGFGYVWGVNTDVPVPGDYDGDGRADLAVFRPSSGHWFILTSSSNYSTAATYQWGTSGDIPVQGNYDADNRTDIAIYRPSTGGWYLLTSSSNFSSGSGYIWGAANDMPVPADYDGDGRTDIAVYRPASAHWFILRSTANFTASATYQWGTTGDIPVSRRQ